MGSQAIDAGAFGKALAITGSANIQPASQWPFLNQSGVVGTNLNGSQIYSGSGGAIDVILADTVGPSVISGFSSPGYAGSGGTGYGDAVDENTDMIGGSGTGLDVLWTSVNGQVVSINQVLGGTGYLNGDLVTVDDGDVNAVFRIAAAPGSPTAAQKVTFTAVPAGTVLPVSVDYVLNTSTATGMVALR